MRFHLIYCLFVPKVGIVVISNELKTLGWLLIIVNPLDCSLPSICCAYKRLDGAHLRIYECIS
jgi:hypothetical protein